MATRFKGPDLSSSRHHPSHFYADQNRHAGFTYILMIVVALAFGGFLWKLYSGPDVAEIAAPPGPYKIEAPATSTPTEALSEADAPPALAPASIEAPPAAAPAGFAAQGQFVAQLAALRSEPGANEAWRRLSARAPLLFTGAQMDIERADLGQRGIYFRLRAGYFAEREAAANFCEQVRQLGQDCIITSR